MWSQVSHCHSLEWFCVLHAVTLLLSWLDLRHAKCFTVAHWGVSVWSKLFQFCLTRVYLCHSRCLTSANSDGYMWSQVSHYNSLWWLHVVPIVPMPLSVVARILSGVSLLLTRVPLFHSRQFFAPYLGGIVSFQMSNCHCLQWYSVITAVLLLLTVVVQHHSKWPIVTYSGDFVFFQFFIGQSVGLFCIFLGIQLLLTMVAPHCLTCLTVTY